MKNYKKLSPAKTKSIPTDFELKINYDSDLYCDEEIINKKNNFHRTLQNFNSKLPQKKRKKEKHTSNILNILKNLINSKVILPSTNFKKRKSFAKNFDVEKEGKFQRKKFRTFSHVENVMNGFQLTNKLFGEEGKRLNKIFFIKDSEGNDIKISFKYKDNNALAPINEEGEEIKDMRILKNIYEQTKLEFNKDAEQGLLQKSFSYDYYQNYISPIADRTNNDNNVENEEKEIKVNKENKETQILNLNEEKIKKEKKKKKKKKKN